MWKGVETVENSQGVVVSKEEAENMKSTVEIIQNMAESILDQCAEFTAAFANLDGVSA